MQRSNMFVLYRQIPDTTEGAKAPFVRVYFSGYGLSDDPDKNYSQALAKANVLDKKTAFNFAVKYSVNGDVWSVGELISDAKGTRVEE